MLPCARHGSRWPNAAAFAAVFSVVVLVMPVTAHHAAPTEFDLGKPIVLRGTLTKMLWANPHGWMYLDVKGPDGNVVPWMVETGAPNTLLRLGWRRSDLLPGTALIVDGFPARDGNPTAHAARVTFADGRVLVSESSKPTGDGLRNPRRPEP
jgi:hypothetical protein